MYSATTHIEISQVNDQLLLDDIEESISPITERKIEKRRNTIQSNLSKHQELIENGNKIDISNNQNKGETQMHNEISSITANVGMDGWWKVVFGVVWG